MFLLCALLFKLLVLSVAYPNPQQDLEIVEDEIFEDKHYLIEPTEECNPFDEPVSVTIENTKVRLLEFKKLPLLKIKASKQNCFCCLIS
jgi:hypothetical protein